MLRRYFHSILINFRFYRRIKGGTWYQVYSYQDEYGLASDAFDWTREKPADPSTIAKVERYK